MRQTAQRQGPRKRTTAETDLDRARYEKELAEAREAGDATKTAQALNNLGTVLTDEGRHAEALEQYEQAIAALDETCPVEDQVISRGNAAQAARQLEQWDKAVDYGLEAESFALANDYKETLNELVVSFLALRRTLGVDRFTELFQAGLEKLPEDRRQHVRADLHLNPTYRKASDGPRRNGPCPCGSGKKHKKCCGKS